MKFLKNIAMAALITTALSAGAMAAIDFSAVDHDDLDAVVAASKMVYDAGAKKVTFEVTDELIDSIGAIKAAIAKSGEASVKNILSLQVMALEAIEKAAENVGNVKAYLATGKKIQIEANGFVSGNAKASTYPTFLRASLGPVLADINPKSDEQKLVEKIARVLKDAELEDGVKVSDLVAGFGNGAKKAATQASAIKHLAALKELEKEVDSVPMGHEATYHAVIKKAGDAHKAALASAKLPENQQVLVDFLKDAKKVKKLQVSLTEVGVVVDLGTKAGAEKLLAELSKLIAHVATLEGEVADLTQKLSAKGSSAPQGAKKSKKGIPPLGGASGAPHDDSGTDDDDAAGVDEHGFGASW